MVKVTANQAVLRSSNTRSIKEVKLDRAKGWLTIKIRAFNNS